MHLFKSKTSLLKLLFAVALFFYSFTIANAEVIRPQRYGTEGHFKTWTYHTNGIYYYEGYYMNPAYIEFADGEKINTMYMQKPDAWQIETINNRMFLKPIDEDADTTLTVMTDQRVYFFELHARVPEGAFDRDITYYVKFRYPNGSGDKKAKSSSSSDGSIIEYVTEKGPDLTKTEMFNFHYTVSGDYNITPIKVFDDGQFTYMEFRDKGGVMPAIFAVDNDGYEKVVNFRMINQYIAIEGVNSVYTLRYGRDTVCVFNEALRGLIRNLTKVKK